MKKIIILLLMVLCVGCSQQNALTNKELDLDTLVMINDLEINKYENKPILKTTPFSPLGYLNEEYIIGVRMDDNNRILHVLCNMNTSEEIIVASNAQFINLLDVEDHRMVYYTYQSEDETSNVGDCYFVLESFQDDEFDTKEFKKIKEVEAFNLEACTKAVLDDNKLYLSYYESNGAYEDDEYLLSMIDFNTNEEKVIENQDVRYVEKIDDLLYYIKYDRKDDVMKLMSYDLKEETKQEVMISSFKEKAQLQNIYEMQNQLILQFDDGNKIGLYQLQNNELLPLFAINKSSLVQIMEYNDCLKIKVTDKENEYLYDIQEQTLYLDQYVEFVESK